MSTNAEDKLDQIRDALADKTLSTTDLPFIISDIVAEDDTFDGLAGRAKEMERFLTSHDVFEIKKVVVELQQSTRKASGDVVYRGY